MSGTNGRPEGPLPPVSSTTLHRSAAHPRRRFRRLLRNLSMTVLVLVVCVSAVPATGWVWADSRLRETAAFAGPPGRPAPGAGTNWLVVGTDVRSGLTPRERRRLHAGGAGERNTDTVMVLHQGAAGPYLVSLPRDSYVPVPGHGRKKINAAYALGGPALLSRTVEEATGLRLDHYAEVDLRGFTGVIDALGGVRVCLAAPLRDARAGADLPAGCRTLDGRRALAYVRARYSDPRGDLGRVERQQRLLGALVREATGPGVLLNPFRGHAVLGAVLDALTVDEGAGVPSLARMAWAVRGLTDGDGGTVTVPVTAGGRGVPGAGDVVVWDEARARELFRQLRRDVPVTGEQVG